MKGWRGLNEVEHRQSGVVAIRQRLEDLQSHALLVLASPQDPNPALDAHKTQWHRAQYALLKKLLDDVGVRGEDEQEGDWGNPGEPDEQEG